MSVWWSLWSAGWFVGLPCTDVDKCYFLSEFVCHHSVHTNIKSLDHKSSSASHLCHQPPYKPYNLTINNQMLIEHWFLHFSKQNRIGKRNSKTDSVTTGTNNAPPSLGWKEYNNCTVIYVVLCICVFVCSSFICLVMSIVLGHHHRRHHHWRNGQSSFFSPPLITDRISSAEVIGNIRNAKPEKLFFVQNFLSFYFFLLLVPYRFF